MGDQALDPQVEEGAAVLTYQGVEEGVVAHHLVVEEAEEALTCLVVVVGVEVLKSQVEEEGAEGLTSQVEVEEEEDLTSQVAAEEGAVVQKH